MVASQNTTDLWVWINVPVTWVCGKMAVSLSGFSVCTNRKGVPSLKQKRHTWIDWRKLIGQGSQTNVLPALVFESFGARTILDSDLSPKFPQFTGDFRP